MSGSPVQVTYGHVLGKGEARMSLLHEPSGETVVSWGLWKEPGQEVFAFRARLMWRAGPSHDHAGSTAPGLAIKMGCWLARAFRRAMQSR